MLGINSGEVFNVYGRQARILNPFTCGKKRYTLFLTPKRGDYYFFLGGGIFCIFLSSCFLFCFFSVLCFSTHLLFSSPPSPPISCFFPLFPCSLLSFVCLCVCSSFIPIQFLSCSFFVPFLSSPYFFHLFCTSRLTFFHFPLFFSYFVFLYSLFFPLNLFSFFSNFVSLLAFFPFPLFFFLIPILCFLTPSFFFLFPSIFCVFLVLSSPSFCLVLSLFPLTLI